MSEIKTLKKFEISDWLTLIEDMCELAKISADWNNGMVYDDELQNIRDELLAKYSHHNWVKEKITMLSG